jgi:hypothetical protein
MTGDLKKRSLEKYFSGELARWAMGGMVED